MKTNQMEKHPCISEDECDCDNPPPDDWNGDDDGVWVISARCPIHNFYPLSGSRDRADIYRN